MIRFVVVILCHVQAGHGREQAESHRGDGELPGLPVMLKSCFPYLLECILSTLAGSWFCQDFCLPFLSCAGTADNAGMLLRGLPL